MADVESSGESSPEDAAAWATPEPSVDTPQWTEVGFDTVPRAVGTPYEHQPFAELGLQ